MLRRTFLATAVLAGAAPALAQLAGDAAPETAAGAVTKLAALLEEGYVIPAQGKRYADFLRARLAARAYADIADRATLAAVLTDQLRGVAADRHLRVAIADAVLPPPRTGVTPAGPARPATPVLQDAGWLADGVAYLRFTQFAGEAATIAALRTFMRDHAGAGSLIIDSRYNGGGGLAEMDVILPYLFAAETPLVRFEMVETIARARGLPFDEETVRALPVRDGIVGNVHYAIPRADETRWRAAKVFYLTSKRTGSAAEHLALAFRHTRRATLVGETTGGANHFGGFEPIGWGLAVFLPVGRTVDLTTGEDWEGAGIAPDVEVPAPRALQEALRRAGVSLPA